MGKRRRREFGAEAKCSDSSDDEDYSERPQPSPAMQRAPKQQRKGPPPARDNKDRAARKPRAPTKKGAANKAAVAPTPGGELAGEGDGLEAAGSSSWAQLPADVLRMVFMHAVEESAVPSAAAVSATCRQWRTLAGSMPELWERLDLTAWPRASFSDALIARCISSGRWAQVRLVRLRDSHVMSGAGLVALARGCPLLASLEVAGCEGCVSKGALVEALQQLPGLTRLDMSRCTIVPHQTGTHQCLMAAIRAHAPGQLCLLRELRARSLPFVTNRTLAGLVQPPAATSAGAALATKPEQPAAVVPAAAAGPSASGLAVAPLPLPPLLHLRVLDLSLSGRIQMDLTLNTDDLQRAAPLLEELRLDGLGGVFGWRPVYSAVHPAPGFPHLQLCEVGSARAEGRQECRSRLSFEALVRLCGQSPHLHTLDASGAPADARLMHNLTSTCLRTLRMSGSAMASDEGLKAVAARFGASLQVLDVSCSTRVSDAGLEHVAASCSALASLDVSGTAITTAGVKQLLAARGGASDAGNSSGGGAAAAGAPRKRSGIEWLDISSCRGVDRETRHAGASGLAALMSCLGLLSS